MKMWTIVLAGTLGMVGCSKPGTPAKPTATNAAQTSQSSNPFAKYLELVGFRIIEKSPGHLEVRFGVVNHSEADIGEVKMDVNVRTTNAKADDPPLIAFSATIPSLGPSEMKAVAVDVPTKLRVYELPDWQFLKPDFVLTEPK
ncbi:MAG: hypothetical protein ABSE86_11675 [Bryobacteraceae bacterium]|jgi:hypothetical protein